MPKADAEHLLLVAVEGLEDAAQAEDPRDVVGVRIRGAAGDDEAVVGVEAVLEGEVAVHYREDVPLLPAVAEEALQHAAVAAVRPLGVVGGAARPKHGEPPLRRGAGGGHSYAAAVRRRRRGDVAAGERAAGGGDMDGDLHGVVIGLVGCVRFYKIK